MLGFCGFSLRVLWCCLCRVLLIGYDFGIDFIIVLFRFEICWAVVILFATVFIVVLWCLVSFIGLVFCMFVWLFVCAWLYCGCYYLDLV